MPVTYRHGLKGGLWDGTTTFNQSTNPGGGVGVATGSTSKQVQVGRTGDNFVLYVTTSAAATFNLQVAHSGDRDSQGMLPDPDAQTLAWMDLWYLGNTAAGVEMKLTFTGSGSLAMYVPDWISGWIRLRASGIGTTATVTAGWEVQPG